MTTVQFGRFQWDADKEELNVVKHKLNFSDAVLALFDSAQVHLPDHKHSHSEERMICIGRIGDEIVTVRYTRRGPFVRILGAGFWRKGRKQYEEKNKKEKRYKEDKARRRWL